MKTTNYAQASYQEIIDLHTEPGGMSVLGIHTPTGDAPYEMFKGFFDQFRKFTYLGASFSLVPAARLPSDIAGVSYGAGETAETVAPEDLLNPIMFKGCHGNDMGTILNTMYTTSHGNSLAKAVSPGLDMNIMGGLAVSDDYDYATEFYYSCLTDNTWLKAHPQSGLRKNGLRPLVYQMASTMPLGLSENGTLGTGQAQYSYAGAPLDNVNEDGSDLFGSAMGPQADHPNQYPQYLRGPSYPEWPQVTDISAGSLFSTQWRAGQNSIFTPRLTRLGWMDTYVWGSTAQSSAIDADNTGNFNQNMNEWFEQLDSKARAVARLPRIFMGMILMPPAVGHQQYYRLMINHRFAWKDFRGISGGVSTEKLNQQRWDFNGLKANTE